MARKDLSSGSTARYRSRTRLGQMQREILDVLSKYPRAPEIHENARMFVGNLARSSDVVEALGGEPTPARHASVSRALARLVDRGLVTAYRGGLYGAGKGFRYALRTKDDSEPG